MKPDCGRRCLSNGGDGLGRKGPSLDTNQYVPPTRNRDCSPAFFCYIIFMQFLGRFVLLLTSLPFPFVLLALLVLLLGLMLLREWRLGGTWGIGLVLLALLLVLVVLLSPPQVSRRCL